MLLVLLFVTCITVYSIQYTYIESIGNEEAIFHCEILYSMPIHCWSEFIAGQKAFMLNFSPLPAGICGQDTPRTKDCRFRPIVLCAWIQKSPGFAGPSTCRCGAAEPSLFQPTYATFAQYSYLTHQRENISYPCPQQTGACFYRSNSSPKHACPCVALLP